MVIVWQYIFFPIIYSSLLVSSSSIDSFFLDRLQMNISDYLSLNTFYQNFLHQIRHHRPTDTVYSSINLTFIESKNYDEKYLNNSCYESTSDLLRAHGYNDTRVKFTINDIESLLPAVFYSVYNPGCRRQPPPRQYGPSTNIWIVGIGLLMLAKCICLIVLVIGNAQCWSLITVKDRLWCCLAFNAFTCGLMLGTFIYHLIPHIYEVPNEDFNYTYLARATVVFIGVYLFFIVEKLLRFRFKADEILFTVTNGMETLPDESMVEMTEVNSTLNAEEVREENSIVVLQSNSHPLNDDCCSSNHQHHHEPVRELDQRTRNLYLYHLLYDFSNDLIYGCGLSTAFAHHHLIGFTIWLVILTEGFRRNTQAVSSLGRELGIIHVLNSIITLLIGYSLGAWLTADGGKQLDMDVIRIRSEYIYSIVYGLLVYSALVILIPELNDYGQRLEAIKEPNIQTSSQKRKKKIAILICQNMFLIIGVVIAMLTALVWRHFHRLHIHAFVCTRDVSRPFCNV